MGIPIFAEVVIPAGGNMKQFRSTSEDLLNLDAFSRVGETYLVRFEGEEYLLPGATATTSTTEYFYIGNPSIYGNSTAEDNGLPFLIRYMNSGFPVVIIMKEKVDYDRTIYCELVTGEAEGNSAGRKYLLHSMFSPMIARALLKE